MAATAKAGMIDELMDQASQALTAMSYFEAEQIALKALAMARQLDDFERMTRITLPLQEARRQRVQQAFDGDVIHTIEESFTEETVIESGCYLIEPPQVGADGRRLRLAALDREIPVAVVCREPITQLRLWPLVCIGPGGTVRTKVDPPENTDEPDMAWFVSAMEAIGDAAIDHLDAALTPVKRVDALLDRLDTIPDHEKLHQALAEACQIAHRESDA